MKNIFMILIFVISANSLICGNESEADNFPDNSINLSLLGYGSFWSLNYDKALLEKEKFMVAAKAGLGLAKPFTFGGSSTQFEWYSYFGQLTYCKGSKKHLIELGLAFTGYIESGYFDPEFNKSQKILIYPVFGYRYRPKLSSNWPVGNTFRIWVSYPLNQNYEQIEPLFSPIGFEIGVAF
jgi:hypothetical protein